MTSFISEEQFNDWFATSLPIYHCKFHKENYKDELFTKLGIQFPASLINSVTKRRAEFLAGRHCANKALQQLNVHNAVIGTGKHRNPRWPDHIKGSISHCDNYAVAVTTDRNDLIGVGIDIESRITEETVEKTQTQILSDAEIELISLTARKKSLAFALAFSMKESFFKAAYPSVQRYFDFNAVTITEIDWNKQTLSFVINEALHEKFATGMQLKGEFYLLPDEKVVTLIVI